LTWSNQQGFDPIPDMDWKMQFVVNTAGSVACETDFISGIRILDASGKPVSIVVKEDVPIYSQIPEGSVIEWRVETLADGKKAASDRVVIDILAMDPSFMTRVSNMAIDSLEVEELLQVVKGDDAPITAFLEKNEGLIDPELAQVTFYSQTVITGDDGKASGTIPIDPAWGKSLFSINFHYGYSQLAEMSTGDKTERVWIEELGPLLVEALVLVALTAISMGAAMGIRLALAAKNAATVAIQLKRASKIAFAYEMAQMAKQYLAKGFGFVGLNKHDCSFPVVGFNHVYAFDTDFEVTMADDAGNIDISKMDVNQLEVLIQKELVRNLAVGVVGTGMLIWILTR